MLRGIPTQISSELLKILADMGHGDTIVIADDFYPFVSKTPGGRYVQQKGIGAAEMIEAILALLPLDAEFSEFPVLCMVPDGKGKEFLQEQEVTCKVIRCVEKSGYAKECAGHIERSRFYGEAEKAFATVSTSERRPYGCFILKKGVL